ncbi:MAG TPA: DUF3347 domain-containing protein [Chitinophagaceae bacterium]|jgi:hypothetical protein|nr:DUF3347 domain-containing protein [Chitinophagaceae bacterium]
MKRVVIVIIVLALAAFAVDKFFFAKKSPADNDTPKQMALTASKNSEAFNASFEKLLNGYFSLKDGITNYDTAKANAAAKELTVFADSLTTSEIKGDSTGDIRKTAENFAGTISGSAKGLVGETDLIKKKREFQMISEALYNLVRTVRYDRQKLYHEHCPMAFGDEEAWWLSNSNKIVNPYLGTKHPKYKGAMIDCGDITDSLDYSKGK